MKVTLGEEGLEVQPGLKVIRGIKMDKEKIAELRALYEAADNGIWTALPEGPNLYVSGADDMPSRVRAMGVDDQGRRTARYIAVCNVGGTNNDANAMFIAAVHSALPELLEYIAELEAQLGEE